MKLRVQNVFVFPTIPKSNSFRARNALFRRKLSFAPLKFALVLVMRRRVYGGANFTVLAMLWVMLESWHRRRVRWRTWTSTIILNDTRWRRRGVCRLWHCWTYAGVSDRIYPIKPFSDATVTSRTWQHPQTDVRQLLGGTVTAAVGADASEHAAR